MVAAVSAVSSAPGATQYYERDGHYAKHAPNIRRAVSGKAAEEISLSKQVDPATFPNSW